MQKQLIRDYDKIGGWLIVVGLGLFGTALEILASLVTDYVPLFSNGTWMSMLTSSSVANGAAIAIFVVIEVLVNLGFVAFSVFLLFQMRDKKPDFPKKARLFYIGNLIFVLFDLIVCFQLSSNAADSATSLYGNLARSIVSTGIWVSYFNRSNRVKQTFRVRPTLSSEETESRTSGTEDPIVKTDQ